MNEIKYILNIHKFTNTDYSIQDSLLGFFSMACIVCPHWSKKNPNLCTGDRSSPRAALIWTPWPNRTSFWKIHDSVCLSSYVSALDIENLIRRCQISVVITRFSLFDLRHVRFRRQWSILIDNWNTLGLFSIHFSDRK